MGELFITSCNSERNDHKSIKVQHVLCEEMVQPDCIPSGEVAQGVLLIAVSGREVGVVCGRVDQNDEKVFSTPRSVL